MRLLLASCDDNPEGSLDTPLLLPALQRAGIEVELLPWPEAAPTEFDACLLHTPWDYAWRPDEFQAWLTGWGERVINSAEVCRWNGHKRYLGELESKGVAVVPCLPVNAGGAVDLEAVANERGWDAVVVKPAIGQTARLTERAATKDLSSLQAHANVLLEAEDILVQEFIPGILDNGERSLVFIDGAFSHSLEKRAAPGDWRVQDDYGGTVHPHVATQAEIEVATRALAVTPGDLLYARVDLVDHLGSPCVIEIELIEPELFLRLEPAAAERLAAGLLRRGLG